MDGRENVTGIKDTINSLVLRGKYENFEKACLQSTKLYFRKMFIEWKAGLNTEEFALLIDNVVANERANAKLYL